MDKNDFKIHNLCVYVGLLLNKSTNSYEGVLFHFDGHNLASDLVKDNTKYSVKGRLNFEEKELAKITDYANMGTFLFNFYKPKNYYNNDDIIDIYNQYIKDKKRLTEIIQYMEKIDDNGHCANEIFNTLKILSLINSECMDNVDSKRLIKCKQNIEIIL